MYDYLIGIITSITQEGITLEVNGIGYRLFATATTCAELQERNTATKLYVSFVIREYSQSLYGFLSQEERNLFEALLNVSGIGPKIALALIGNINPQDLASAVLQKDISTLCKIPGIGKKTAERLLVELKDTLAEFQFQTLDTKGSQTARDAVSALINLGYSQFAAQKAVKKAVEKHGDTKELPYLISLSLKEAS